MVKAFLQDLVFDELMIKVKDTFQIPISYFYTLSLRYRSNVLARSSGNKGSIIRCDILKNDFIFLTCYMSDALTHYKTLVLML